MRSSPQFDLATTNLVQKGAAINPHHHISHELIDSTLTRKQNRNRQSSGKATPKLITNESIKPLPTSFALQHQNQSNNLSSNGAIHQV